MLCATLVDLCEADCYVERAARAVGPSNSRGSRARRECVSVASQSWSKKLCSACRRLAYTRELRRFDRAQSQPPPMGFRDGESLREHGMALRLCDNVSHRSCVERQPTSGRLRDEWRRAPTLSNAVRVAGVHPCHLAQTFREQMGESIGSYVRRLRVTWPLAGLTATDVPVSQVALSAGFCDQSHFTWRCVRFTSVTPAAYRAQVRGSRAD